MTKVQINLPDALAREAAQAGLLNSESLENLLRAQLRATRLDALKASMAALEHDREPAMTLSEISSEIKAYRAEQRRAAGS